MKKINCIFILNKRDPIKLLDSFKRWKNLYTLFIKYNSDLLIEGDNNDDKFINLVIKHYNDVNDFFNSKSDAKFIEFDIENDNIEKLNIYIDTKDKKFPHCNINNSKSSLI